MSKIDEKCKKVAKSVAGRSRDGLPHPMDARIHWGPDPEVDFWKEKVAPKGDFGAKLGGQVGPKLFFGSKLLKNHEKSIQEGVQKKFRKMMEK